ncbi:methyltransferase domain-containing protein [Candidatus Roizmanbacteria bacterium]|nr:methyltransferase domain-containing protein [Candidatus Roizmanbacteria bacterium]
MNIVLEKKYKYYNYKFFAKWARLYDYEKYITFPLKQKAARFLDLKSPKKILDVATGTGAQAYEIAKLGHNVVGIDLSPEMLEQTKKKISSNLKLRFQQADGTNLPFKDNSFDASTISLGLHDTPYEIELLVLKEMKRATKKGGSILIVDYNEPKKLGI